MNSKRPWPKSGLSQSPSSIAEASQLRKKYMFVPALEDDYVSRRNTRVHVMREIMREKRMNREETRGQTKDGEKGHRYNLEAETWLVEVETGREATKRPCQVQRFSSEPAHSNASTLSSVGLEEVDLLTSDHKAPENSQSRQPGALSSSAAILSEDGRDLLEWLPPNMTRGDIELADYYVRIIPGTTFSIAGKGLCNPFLDKDLREIVRDPAVLHALILAYAARHRADASGLSETVEFLNHKSKAIRLINERLSVNPSKPSDGTILAALSLTSLEDRWGNYEAAWVHMRGAIQMIRNRGGPKSFRNNWIITLLANWTDYILKGLDVSGASISFEPTMANAGFSVALNSDFARRPIFPGSCDIRVFCQTFLTFLRNAGKLKQLQSHGSKNHPILSEGSPLRYVFTVLPKACHATEGRLRSISRMTSLLYLTKAVWDYRDSLNKLEALIEVLENESTRTWSIEHILWLLIKYDAQSPSGNTERPWFIGQMLKVAKRLSEDRWEKLMSILLAILMQDEAFLCDKESQGQLDEIERCLDAQILMKVPYGVMCSKKSDK